MGYLKAILIVTMIVYALAAAGLYFTQEQFIFQNDSTRIDPKQDWVEVVELDTPDGETLVGWYAPPRLAGCPTILMLHGNGSRLDRDAFRFQRVHDAGYGLLAIAFRGYSGSTGQPSEQGLHIDSQTAWDWLTGEQSISPDQIVVHGNSMGSGVAVQLAARENPGALVLEAPFKSMQAVVQGVIKVLPASLLVKHKFRSDKHIGKVKAPILMAHGTADSVVPITQSKTLFELAPEPKTYKTFEGSEHNTLVNDGLYETAVGPFLKTIYPACDPLQTQEETTR